MIITLLGLAVFFTLLAFGIHVSTTLFLLGVGTGFFSVGTRILVDFGNQAWKMLNNYTLLAVPLFVFIGELLIKAEITEDLYNGLNKWLGRLPGGLLHTNIGASAILAATSGSSVATSATIGLVSIPILERRKYNMKLVLGSICAGGTLGILIPPSINMIIYGTTANVSIGRLFLAGFIPGAILTVAFLLVIAFLAIVDPKIQGGKEDKVPFLEKLVALKYFLPVVFIIATIMGSIYLGWATATEAGALGVIAILIVILLRKKMSRKVLNEALVSTIKTTSTILFITIAASYFNYVLSYLGLPQQVTKWFINLPLSPFALMALITVFYIILGALMETIALMITTIPLIVPVVVGLGYDPVWFGVYLMLICQFSLITPPIGMNLYVVQSTRAKQSPLSDVIIGTIPFLIMMVIVVVILVIFPGIATYLPDAVYGVK